MYAWDQLKGGLTTGVCTSFRCSLAEHASTHEIITTRRKEGMALPSRLWGCLSAGALALPFCTFSHPFPTPPKAREPAHLMWLQPASVMRAAKRSRHSRLVRAAKCSMPAQGRGPGDNSPGDSKTDACHANAQSGRALPSCHPHKVPQARPGGATRAARPETIGSHARRLRCSAATLLVERQCSRPPLAGPAPASPARLRQ